MPTYITATDVRRACGAPSSLISDTDINSIIDIVEKEVERWMNTKFVPTLRVDIIDGLGSGVIFTKKNPLLSVRKLVTNDAAETPANLEWYKPSGKIVLGEDATISTFQSKFRDTRIKYLYGFMDESSTNTTNSAATTAGTSVSITVASITGFSANDWCEIYSTDGNREVFQISGTPAGGAIVADELVQTHESGSIIVKLEIPYTIKRFMEIEAGIAVAVNAIGSTYTFNTSYTIGELTINKGEPYPQWREVILRLINERKMRKATIKIRPAIVVS